MDQPYISQLVESSYSNIQIIALVGMCSILFFRDNTIQLCHGASVTLDGKTSTLDGHHWDGSFFNVASIYELSFRSLLTGTYCC